MYLASTQSTIYVYVRANCLLHFFFCLSKAWKIRLNQTGYECICMRAHFLYYDEILVYYECVLATNFDCVCVRWSCFYLFGKCIIFMHLSRLFQLDGYTLTNNSQFYFLSYQILLLLLGCRSSTHKRKKKTNQKYFSD